MSAQTAVPVALLFQTDELGRHLRAVLNDLGTPIVYESTTREIDRASLDESGARVVVVNLDSELDGDLETVYDLLGDGPYRVLINEGQVSSQLSGWDQARWVRHLAAKILDAPAATDPPRPAGAEPVPTPVSRTPEHETAPPVLTAAPEDAGPIAALPADRIADEQVEVDLPSLEDILAVPEATAGVIVSEDDELFSFDDLDAAPPALPTADYASADESGDEPAETIVLLDDFGEIDAFAAIPAAPPADEDAEPVTFSDEEARLLADFDATDGEDAARRDAPAADLDDWLSRAMSDDPTATIERPQWEDAPVEPESEPVLRIDTQPVFSDSFEPATDAQPAVPAVPDWSLVSFDIDEPAAPEAAPPAAFGVEKISAAEYMAAALPYVEETSRDALASDGLSLELVPIEDAIAPQSTHVEHEVWLDADAAAASPARPSAAAAAIGRVVVLCASIGGPEAVREVIGAVRKDDPALFVLVQHMGEEFIDLLAQQLARATTLTIRVPSHGERVAAGDLLIAPPNRDLQIQRDGTVLIQPQTQPTAHQPSIDRVLEAVAGTFGADALAIVFSGMSDDGAEGCRRLADAGGQIWVQDPATCVVSEMVDSVLATGVAQFEGSPTSLAQHLAGLRDAAQATP